MIRDTARNMLLLLIGTVFLFFGCKQSERTVVGDAPTTAAADTTDREQDDEEFRSLTIGEHHKIITLDPLHARNTSSMRAVQLMYEGLLRFDADGELQPAIASEWSVSEDSLEYTFNLKSDIYYHDSDAFSTGTGRRLVADDVKWVFERMANAGVPSHAARLFMNIEGFGTFYQEQQNLFYPEQRTMDEVQGITVPDDSTVVFQLEQADPDFLKKIATPLAVIYPSEAVGISPEEFTPVGTGPFRFSQQGSDSTFIFTKFQNHAQASSIYLNRVDIISTVSESILFQRLGSGDIHLLPEIGPQVLQHLLDEDGQLTNSHAERYELMEPGGEITYTLQENPSAPLPEEVIQSTTDFFASDTLFSELPGEMVEYSPTDTTDYAGNEADETDQLYTLYSEEPYIRNFLSQLSDFLAQEEYSLQMTDLRTPTKETPLLVDQQLPLLPTSYDEQQKLIGRFQVQHRGVQQNGIEGGLLNEYPWWISLYEVNVSGFEN